MTTRQRILRALTWLLVAVIAGIAFTASFEAIAGYAGRVGWGPRMRYAAPLLVDTFTVAAGLVILARAEDRERAIYAWTVLIIASAVSIGLNIAHARRSWDARLVAALPPVALLAAVELAMSEARRARRPYRIAHELAALAVLATTWAERGERLAIRARATADAAREGASAGGVGERAPHGPPQVQARATTPVRAAAAATSGDAAASADTEVARPERALDPDLARLIRELYKQGHTSEAKMLAALRARGRGTRIERIRPLLRELKIAGNGSAHVRVDASA
jgi:hypothetical protein